MMPLNKLLQFYPLHPNFIFSFKNSNLHSSSITNIYMDKIKPIFLLVISLVLTCQYHFTSGADEIGSSNAGNEIQNVCSVDLARFLPLPYSNLPNVVCKPVWNSYIIRYSQTKDHVITIVLSALYTSGWVGIGFSKDGMMLNSSCMVGWITQKGVSRIKQYYLRGFVTDQVIPDKGELPLTSVPPYIAIYGATIYLAFQLKYPNRLKTQPVLLAFGSKYPQHHKLSLHDDKTTIQFDFSAVSGDEDPVMSSSLPVDNSITNSRKTHGLLGLFGWGMIMPYGAIIARYFKQQDPLWYYLHVAIQFIGFIIALAGVVLGVSLYNKLHLHFPSHRGIGIFALVLSILQVLAFFIRPSKESKNRRYWNWYHHWVGRISLLFGAINIVLGFQIGGVANSWKIGYGFMLGSVLISTIVLEALFNLRKSEKPLPPHPPPTNFQMNTI